MQMLQPSNDKEKGFDNTLHYIYNSPTQYDLQLIDN